MFDGLLNMLVGGIFQIITTLCDAFMQPFINTLLLLFPDLATPYTHFISFLSSAFIYLSTILRWFLFTPQMFATLFAYFFTKFSIYVATNVVRTALRFYNTFKP